MSMTVKQALEQVAHYLHNATSPFALRIVNDAGQYLHTMHPWRWASGQEHQITAVSGQSEYELPLNVRDVTRFVSASRSYIDVAQIPWEDLVRREQYGAASPGWYTVALRYDAGSVADDVGGQSDGIPRLVMRVWPSPAAEESITVLYRRGWTELRRDDDIIAMPDWVHPLFEMLLRAFALGIHDDKVGALHQRLDEITGNPMARIAPSSLYINTRSRDGSIDGVIGHISGGAGRAYSLAGQYGDSRVYPGIGSYTPPPR